MKTIKNLILFSGIGIIALTNFFILQPKSTDIRLSSLVVTAKAGDESCPWYVTNCEAYQNCGNHHYDCDALFTEYDKGTQCEVQDCWTVIFKTWCVTRVGTWVGCQSGGPDFCTGYCSV